MFKQIDIEYEDSENKITLRAIKDIEILNAYTLQAFCLLRGGVRTFSIDRIKSITTADSCEKIYNVHDYFGVLPRTIEKITTQINSANLMYSVKALKYFCLQIRPKVMVQRERKIVTDFIYRHCAPSCSHDDLDVWYKKLYVGDWRFDGEPNYGEWLKRIPENQLIDCKSTALKIAKGSGRIPVKEEIINRINSEFTERVVYPWRL